MASPFKKFEAYVYRRFNREAPLGRLHRFAFWLLIIYLLLGFGRLLRGGWGELFAALSFLDLCALLICCIPLFWRWVVSRLLWKLSNRLVATYILMSLPPVVLFVTLAGVAAYFFSGQFAIYAAKAEIHRELARLGADNRAFTEHVAHELEAAPNAATVTLPDFDDSEERGRAALEVAVFHDGKPVELRGAKAVPGGVAVLPSWVKSGYRGLVVGGGRIFLRAVDIRSTGSHTLTVISSVPLRKENVAQLASGLGTVTIFPSLGLDDDDQAKGPIASEAAPPSARKPGLKFEVGRPAPGATAVQVNGRNFNRPEEEPGAVTGGTLPPPIHFFDVPVSFVSPLQTTIWNSGQSHDAFLHVDSRPSLLYGVLFETALQVGTIIQDILISIAIFFAILELIAFIMGIRLNRTITLSISQLYIATQEVDRGNLSHRIDVRRKDQLAALCTSFNGMTASLERLLAEQREKERLQNELEIAQEVQANLFPRGNIALPMLELHGVCRPARTVSGDYYDFLLFSPTSLGLALGDISGKGISAALLMATLHSAVRAYRFAAEELITTGSDALQSNSLPVLLKGQEEINCGELFESPGKVLALLNRHLYRSTQPEKYATLFLAHYQGEKNQLTYSNGGQLPPLVLRTDYAVDRLDCGGTVVGLMDNMSYEQGSVYLRDGDIVIAYSDGVTEPENEFGDFGEERLVEVVSRHRHLSLPAISDQVMQALRSWIGTQEQPDDITLVLARQR